MSKEISDTPTQDNLFIQHKCPIRLIRTGEVTDDWCIGKSGLIIAIFSNGKIIYPYANLEIFFKDSWINFEFFRETMIASVNSMRINQLFDKG